MSLKSKIESLLFVSNTPFTAKRLGELTGQKKDAVTKALGELVKEYKERKDTGVVILRTGDKVQMVSSPDSSKVVQKFIKDETTGELTRASLETLTIIAYRGPITKAELERIRGVNCSIILRNLLMRGLIESKHDKKKMENSYTMTMDFIKYLGINEAQELPDYEKLSQAEKLEEMLQAPTAEEPEK